MKSDIDIWDPYSVLSHLLVYAIHVTKRYMMVLECFIVRTIDANANVRMNARVDLYIVLIIKQKISLFRE